MELSKTWLTDRWIDAEYKNYLLLGYLKRVAADYEQHAIYPHLADLVEHHRELILLQAQAHTEDYMEKELKGFDFENFRLKYQKIASDDAVFTEIMKTADFSVPRFSEWIIRGKEIYEMVESQLQFEPVGVMPLQASEGYLMLQNNAHKTVEVYEYQVTLFENASDKYRSIRTEYVVSYPHTIRYTYAAIKNELLQYRRHIPNPATFMIRSGMDIPFFECFFPVARRMLMKQVSC